jgi:hypothetical protein
MIINDYKSLLAFPTPVFDVKTFFTFVNGSWAISFNKLHRFVFILSRSSTIPAGSALHRERDFDAPEVAEENAQGRVLA